MKQQQRRANKELQGSEKRLRESALRRVHNERVQHEKALHCSYLSRIAWQEQQPIVRLLQEFVSVSFKRVTLTNGAKWMRLLVTPVPGAVIGPDWDSLSGCLHFVRRGACAAGGRQLEGRARLLAAS